MNWNLVGHTWAIQLLKEQLIHTQVRQAYLFTGLPGIGRRSLALAFAQAISCPTPVQPAEPCGVCRTCQLIERQQHPDLDIIKAEAGNRDIKVDQIRALQHRLSLAPYESKFRIGILLNFQDANQNAQNALLKTLEEAPDKVILLLTADSPEALLPTIVSRCEVMRLRPLPLEEAIRYLRSLPDMDLVKARNLAHLTGGRVGYARYLLDNPAELEKQDGMISQLLELLPASQRQRFGYAEQLTREWGKSRDNLTQAIQVWLSVWRDILMCASGSEASLVNLEREAELRKLAVSAGRQNAQRVVTALEDGLKKIEANANARLLAEVLLMQMPRLVQVFQES